MSSQLEWPDIEFELVEAKRLSILSGKVLNAGCGWRDISEHISGELINLDLQYENESRTHVHIYSDLHEIPLPDQSVDTILCIAVLEHVSNPVQIVNEFFRVLKPGGYVVASVPFLQPEHKIPTDYQRYTKDGLEYLFSNVGFDVQKTFSIFNVYYTLHWISAEWAKSLKGLRRKLVTAFVLRFFAFMAKRSDMHSDVIASAFQCIAKKPS